MTVVKNLTVLSLLLLFANISFAQKQIILPPGAGHSTQVEQASVQSVISPAVDSAPQLMAAPSSTGMVPMMAPSVTNSTPTAPVTWDSSQTEQPMNPKLPGCDNCATLWTGACSPAHLSIHASTVGCDRGDCNLGDCQNGCFTGEYGLWSHYTSVYAAALYLRPRNADVSYAVPIDGASQSLVPAQIAGVGTVDPDYEPGVLLGVNLAIDCVTSLYAEMVQLETATSDHIGTEAPNVLRSLVSHPSTSSVATDFLIGSAALDLKLETFDLGIRHLFVGGRVFAVNYMLGARYARLEQEFGTTFLANGTERIATDIDFDGIGPRIGIEAERKSCHSPFGFYARGNASFLAGRFRGDYSQSQSFDPSVISTDWEAGRIVPVLDLEIGANWCSQCGRFRVAGGYVVSAWFNTVKTEDFIQAVQQNNFVDLHDTVSFDGLRFQAELRF